MVLELARSVLAEVDAGRVVAVACTGQWASTIPVDAAGEPVGPCLMWLDTRGAEHARKAVGGPLLGYNPRALLTWVWRTAGVPHRTAAIRSAISSTLSATSRGRRLPPGGTSSRSTT
jgi:xylulokinase